MRPGKSMSARDRKVYLICVCLAVAVAGLALLRELQILHDFRIETSKLAPGTEIRPIGVAAAQAIPELGGILLGACCVVPAVILSWKGRSWFRVALALLIFALTFIPITVVGPAFLHVVQERGLILEE